MGERSRIDELEAILNAPDGPPVTIRPDGTIETVASESDDRTVNNTMRHQYRVLDEKEKAAMLAIKDAGLAFLQLIDNTVQYSREASLAKTKIEEAVMWAVKGITN